MLLVLGDHREQRKRHLDGVDQHHDIGAVAVCSARFFQPALVE
jgi:hypothetical protein